MRPRGRPKKYRIIRADPRISQFSPRGKPGRPDEITLNMDQFEALRLADFKGLTQKEAAKSMQISQQTFSRIIKKAHKAIAQALVKGNIIRIQGGSYCLINPK
ncbi:MAG: DUF134 domain-containing protein [Candidatus Omnitrophica bacterium]|nr:DUF134 domain-containing protein [Candidatus Omnitrophota bacterium]